MNNISNALSAALCAFTVFYCVNGRADPLANANDKHHKAELASKAKASNWLVFNRLADDPNAQLDIIGIYVSPAGDQPIRFKKTGWGRNLISKPIGRGEYAALYINVARNAWYDVRIDFDGKDAQGKPLQYFHKSVRFYPKGILVHQAIRSFLDESSPWKIADVIDEQFSE